jgi:acetate kinase
MTIEKFSGSPAVLSVNSGSSSLKIAYYRVQRQTPELICEGQVESVGAERGRIWIETFGNPNRTEHQQCFADHHAAITAAFDILQELNFPSPTVIGNRIVHGGPDLHEPVRITDDIVKSLTILSGYMPNHSRAAMQCIDAAKSRFPGVLQIACFDTAFHWNTPELARRFPLPRCFWDQGMHRYGFHGLSYEYVMAEIGSIMGRRSIIAHLGNGASMTAVRDGRPADTTMGFSPLGGFMMGTRSGDLDPGLIIFLMQEKGFDADRIMKLVSEESGLKGVSGSTADMKRLLDNSANDPQAAQAVEMFCYHVRKHIGALSAVLGGLDTLVFTGGIGSAAAPIRSRICQGLEYLGVCLDPERNSASADMISIPESACTVLRIKTNENLMIARHACNCASDNTTMEQT